MNELLDLMGPEGTSSFTYDSLGREFTRSLPNGTSVATGYYTSGQTRSIITRNPAQEIIDSVGYIYNQAGQLNYEIDHRTINFFLSLFRGEVCFNSSGHKTAAFKSIVVLYTAVTG